MEEPMVKRAITLGGGGPAAGLHIGVLKALADDGKTFDDESDVWALSCIGAWVGIVHNQFNEERIKKENKSRAELTYEFFRDGVFRDDEGYKRFPINTVFGADWNANIKAFQDFVTDPKSYSDFRWQPYKMMEQIQGTMSAWFNRLPRGEEPFKEWREGDINNWILNEVLAPNPFVRYLTSLMYLSKVNGLSRINYPDSEFMKSINFGELKKDRMPHIYHNAWNLDEQKLALFSNRRMKEDEKKQYKGAIDSRSLCACSSLPFVEGTVEIDQVTYCEGALVDTVNFDSLLEEHPDLDEIWVSRIVDAKQIRRPENLHDALANLCQLFAATVGEDDVKLFKYHVKEAHTLDRAAEAGILEKAVECGMLDKPAADGKNGKKPWRGVVIEIHVPGHINFKWNHSNLENSITLGYAAAKQAIDAFNKAENEIKANIKNGKLLKPIFINENPQHDANWLDLRDRTYAALKKAASGAKPK
jgi:predicted acylesterase/phospholipase RssA